MEEFDDDEDFDSECEQVFKGECIGVCLDRRAIKDKHIMLKLLVEDDGNWHEQDFCVDSYWIDELIRQLRTAKAYMEEQCVKDGKYGWKFKK